MQQTMRFYVMLASRAQSRLRNTGTSHATRISMSAEPACIACSFAPLQYLMPMGAACFLLEADFSSILGAGAPLALAFMLGAIGMVLGACGGFFLLEVKGSVLYFVSTADSLLLIIKAHALARQGHSANACHQQHACPCQCLPMPVTNNIMPMPVTYIMPMPITNIMPMPVTNIMPMHVTNVMPMPVTNIMPMPVTNIMPMPVTNTTTSYYGSTDKACDESLFTEIPWLSR